MKLKLFIALLILVCAGVAFTALKNLPVSYLPVKKAMQTNGTAQIAGRISVKNENANSQIFTLTDSEKTKVRIIFKKNFPITDGALAAVIGKYDAQSGYFVAEKVLLKCPTKYESEYESHSNR